ncbi:unnamed protein product [Ilex paraguariensis]|uniref:Uncharacterized protein n=1 Tax=Ilex paraguariensis TaxID=185542 RepID=A0ABC8UTQ4_9AQUA
MISVINRIVFAVPHYFVTSLTLDSTGLCKSKWEKTGRYPSGNYEYIDVNVAGTRYIVEVFLAGEFKIARPTDHYTSLLNFFPLVFVGKIDELKQVVRLMCNAIKKSMKTMDMHVPPWRRHGYLQARWFSSYKRTIKEIPARKGSDCSHGDLTGKKLVGFVAVPPISYYCREDYASKVGLTVGNLAMVLNGSSIL